MGSTDKHVISNLLKKLDKHFNKLPMSECKCKNVKLCSHYYKILKFSMSNEYEKIR